MQPRQVCSTCQASKPLSEFSFRKDTKKHRTECKKCRSTRTVLKSYGVTHEYISGMRDKQQHKCAICEIPSDCVPHGSFRHNPLVIDHDHRTREVRGLLCPTCNAMLGLAKDSPRILRNAIKYLSSVGSNA